MEFTGERFVPQIDGDIKYEHLHRYAIAMEFVADKTVLDIASGEGYGSALLAQRALSVVGVDIDVDSVNHAQTQYADWVNLKFLVGSCDAIPLADASIDVVVSFETIEHHDRHEEMMQEIKRVLKPGGTLVISSPNRLVYSDESGYQNPYHVQELYYDELLDLLGRYFQQVQIYGQKLALGSWVTALETSQRQQVTAYSGDEQTLTNQLQALPSPVYFMAVCSDHLGTLPVIESLYVDVDDLWQQFQAARNQERDELLQKCAQYHQQLTQLHQDHARQLADLQQDHGRQLADLHQRYAELNEQYLHRQAAYERLLKESEQQLHQIDQLKRDQSALQQQIQTSAQELQESHRLIQAMESSKFWKLRRTWLELKAPFTR